MKILKIHDEKFHKSIFEKVLNFKIDKMEFKKQCLMLHGKETVVVLQCEDIRKILKINYNIIDEGAIVKDNEIIVHSKDEVYRGRVKRVE